MPKYLPVSLNNISWDFKIKKFIAGFNNNKIYRNQIWLGSFSREDREQLFTKEIWQDLQNDNEFADLDNYLSNITDNNFYHQLIYLYLKTYLMDDILVNFDDYREPLAMKALIAFADKRQVIALTCHKNALDIYKRYGAKEITFT